MNRLMIPTVLCLLTLAALGAKGKACRDDAYFPAGLSLDIRVACIIEQPLDPDLYEYDAYFPTIDDKAWCFTPAKRWREVFDYWMDGTVPVDHRVLCGEAVPSYSMNATLAMAALTATGYTGLAPSGAEAICNLIVNNAGDPFTQPDP